MAIGHFPTNFSIWPTKIHLVSQISCTFSMGTAISNLKISYFQKMADQFLILMFLALDTYMMVCSSWILWQPVIIASHIWRWQQSILQKEYLSAPFTIIFWRTLNMYVIVNSIFKYVITNYKHSYCMCKLYMCTIIIFV